MSAAAILDARGLAVTAPTAVAAERFDALMNDLYYYRPGTLDRLAGLLDEYPDFVLAHVLMGYSLMGEGTLGGRTEAEKFLHQAAALPASRREHLHQEALRAWIAGDRDARAAAWEQILIEWPLDLLAFRQYTGTLFWSGDKRHQAEVTSGLAGHWDSRTPGYGHFLSAHAFAMEEIGVYTVAERCAREALAIQPQDLWALHALAHVLEMQGRTDEGIELLSEAASFLNEYNLFRGHVWWHLSLFKLTQSRFDQALDLFDREIYPKESTFFLDIQNGVSLLARLEFQGVDVGLERWERLARGSLQSATQCNLWFTAMHHVMALVRSGRESAAQAAFEFLDLAGRDSAQAALAAELARAAAMFYSNRHSEALDRLLAVRQRHGELGASHAQQDLYDQIAVMAALRVGDLNRVRHLLKARLATRVWDAPSWQLFENRARQVDEVNDTTVIRAALRWDLD